MTTTVPKPEGSQAPDPSDSPAHQTETQPPLVPPLLDIPFVCTPPVGHPFAGLIVGPTQKKWDCPPVAHSVINATSKPMSLPKRSRLVVNTALHRAMRTCLNWHWRIGPALNHKGRTYQSPFQSNQGNC